MIKTIILDYAGVITPTRDNLIFANQYQERFNKSPSELMDITYKNWHEAVVGKISDKKYWKLLSEDLGVGEEEIKRMIIDTFPVEKRLVDLLDEIKDRYTLVMMSNQIEDWLESEIDKNNLRDVFDYFVNSYQVRMKKPDKEIFLYALKECNSKPEEALFIDDSKKNVEVARELGMEVIQFENFEQFMAEFQKYI